MPAEAGGVSSLGSEVTDSCHLAWVLGIKLGASAGVVNVLTCRGVSPALEI